MARFGIFVCMCVHTCKYTLVTDLSLLAVYELVPVQRCSEPQHSYWPSSSLEACGISHDALVEDLQQNILRGVVTQWGERDNLNHQRTWQIMNTI